VINDSSNSDGSLIAAIPENAMNGRSGMSLPVVVEGIRANYSSQTGRLTKVVRFIYSESAQASTYADVLHQSESSQQTIIPNIFQYLRTKTPDWATGLTYRCSIRHGRWR
jgi:hypothetical protein